mgnify:CR=1 FL=1
MTKQSFTQEQFNELVEKNELLERAIKAKNLIAQKTVHYSEKKSKLLTVNHVSTPKAELTVNVNTDNYTLIVKKCAKKAVSLDEMLRYVAYAYATRHDTSTSNSVDKDADVVAYSRNRITQNILKDVLKLVDVQECLDNIIYTPKSYKEKFGGSFITKEVIDINKKKKYSNPKNFLLGNFDADK